MPTLECGVINRFLQPISELSRIFHQSIVVVVLPGLGPNVSSTDTIALLGAMLGKQKFVVGYTGSFLQPI